MIGNLLTIGATGQPDNRAHWFERVLYTSPFLLPCLGNYQIQHYSVKNCLLSCDLSRELVFFICSRYMIQDSGFRIQKAHRREKKAPEFTYPPLQEPPMVKMRPSESVA